MNKFLKMLAVAMSILMVAGAMQSVQADAVVIQVPCAGRTSCVGNNCNTSAADALKDTVKKAVKKKTAKKTTKKKSKTKKSVKKNTKKKTAKKNKMTVKKVQKKNSSAKKSQTAAKSQKKEETTAKKTQETTTKKEEKTTAKKAEETTAKKEEKTTAKKAEETTTKKTEGTTAAPTSTESQYVARIVELVNEQRAKAGLRAVTLDNTLKNAAMTRAKETVTSFSHTRPNGTSFSTVLSEYNISYRGCGENIAWGQNTPEEVMNGWMNSAGHRANILNANFTKIGVGYYKAANGRKYWSQLFTY